MRPLEEIEAGYEKATAAPWGIYWADPTDEAEKYAEALRLSFGADRERATSSTAWRLTDNPDPDDPEWLNLGFLGNGPTSQANATFIAHARTDVPELVEAVRTRDTRIAELTEALTTYRAARRAMVQAVQSGQVAPQHVTSQILEAEALAGRALEGRHV